MKNLFTFAFCSLLFSGCASHVHSVTVTSNPSGKRFSFDARNERGGVVQPLNYSFGNETLVTPYELVFPEDVSNVRVGMRFKTGVLTKSTSLQHDVTYETVREPVLGLPLMHHVTDKLANKVIHFDTPELTPVPVCEYRVGIAPIVTDGPVRGERLTQDREYGR